MYKMKSLLACIAVFLLFSSGCDVQKSSNPTPTPKPRLMSDANQIRGTWMDDTGYVILNFIEDGTLDILSMTGTEKNIQYLFSSEKYWFDGSALRINQLKAGESFYNCFMYSGGNTEGSYEVEILENGDIKFRVISEACSSRKAHFLSTENTVFRSMAPLPTPTSVAYLAGLNPPMIADACCLKSEYENQFSYRTSQSNSEAIEFYEKWFLDEGWKSVGGYSGYWVYNQKTSSGMVVIHCWSKNDTILHVAIREEENSVTVDFSIIKEESIDNLCRGY